MTPEQSGRPYAWWISRVGCWLIDAVVPAVLILVGYGIGRPTYSLETQSINGVEYQVSVASGLHPAFYVLIALAAGFTLWNKGFREGRTGKSVGKQLLGFTTLSQATGKPLGVVRATLRCVLLVVDFALCYLGVLWPLWDEKRQCLVSDKVTGSIVVGDR